MQSHAFAAVFSSKAKVFILTLCKQTESWLQKVEQEALHSHRILSIFDVSNVRSSFISALHRHK